MQSRLIDGLQKILGKTGVLYTPEDLAVYGYDGTFVEARPDIVVLPETTEQVSQIVKLAAETRISNCATRHGIRVGSRICSIPCGWDCTVPDSHEPYFGDRYRKFNDKG